MSEFDELAILPGSPQECELLRRQLNSLNEQENTILAAAIQRQPPTTVAEAAEHLRSLDKYTVCTPAGSYRQLGIYYLEHETNCPPEIYPYVDLEQLGELYEDNHPGLFIGNCFVVYPPNPSMAHADQVVKKEELPHFLQKQAAPEQGRDECREQIIHLELEVRGQECLLVLPDDSEHLDQMRGNLEISDFAEAKINDIAFSVPYLADLIPTDAISVEGANEMAEYIEDMLSQDGALLKFCSVLEAEEPDNFPAALALAQNLDDYERVLDDTEEYGKAVLTHIGADDEIISTIDGYTDFDALGRDMMAEDGVLRTQFGLIRRLSAPFQEEAPGQVMT
jgi:hypothetical protein